MGTSLRILTAGHQRAGMASDPTSTGEPDVDPPMEDRELLVVLDIERGGPCPMDDIANEIVDVEVRLAGDSCNVDATVRHGEGVRTRHFSRPLCTHCPGTVFPEHGCLPRYRRIEEGSFVVETYVSDTETVAALVGDVREICERVSVRSIVSTAGSAVEELCAVDVSTLTAKQREAVHRAQEAGYFDPESSVSLEELADRMDVSPSALSQRLGRAEANVLRQLSCECSCWRELE